MFRKILLCCAIGFAGACGGGGAGGDEAVMEKTIVMMEDLAKVVESSGDDCGKMATGVEGVMKNHEGNIAAAKALKEKYKDDKAKQEEMKKLSEKYKDRMMKAMPAMMGMAKCQDDPKMKAIEGKLRGL